MSGKLSDLVLRALKVHAEKFCKIEVEASEDDCDDVKILCDVIHEFQEEFRGDLEMLARLQLQAQEGNDGTE